MNRKHCLQFCVMLVLLLTLTLMGCQKAQTSSTDSVDTVVATNAQGQRLSAFLNSLEVETYWAKGHNINWETGAILPEQIEPWATNEASHCSAYASSVCARLNAPILHTPFPSGTHNGVTYTSIFADTYGTEFSDITAESDSYLASQQAVWLGTYAQSSLPGEPATVASPKNWCIVDAYQAQSYANQGYLGIVVYKNPTGEAGHIAIIAPEQSGVSLGDYPGKSTPYTSLEVDGPFTAQAGGLNSSYTTVSRGFISQQWFGAESDKNLVKFYIYYAFIDIPSI